MTISQSTLLSYTGHPCLVPSLSITESRRRAVLIHHKHRSVRGLSGESLPARRIYGRGDGHHDGKDMGARHDPERWARTLFPYWFDGCDSLPLRLRPGIGVGTLSGQDQRILRKEFKQVAEVSPAFPIVSHADLSGHSRPSLTFRAEHPSTRLLLMAVER